MWKNEENLEYESGMGCTWKKSCEGTATWSWYGGAQWFQFFCSDEQAQGTEDLEVPYA